jgi:hypothetical protein
MRRTDHDQHQRSNALANGRSECRTGPVTHRRRIGNAIQTGWSIKQFVRTARCYRTVQINAGRQTLTAADSLPDDLLDALAKISSELNT